MTKWKLSLLVLALAGLNCGASAQTNAERKEPPPAAAGRPNQGGPGAQAASGMAAMQGMDRQMKAMQDLRARLAAAKTPAEREALMTEHSKLMQEGMATMMSNMGQMPGMGGMRPGPDAADAMAPRMQMMEKRMEMMQSMMQMMMDRLPPPAAGKK